MGVSCFFTIGFVADYLRFNATNVNNRKTKLSNDTDNFWLLQAV